AAPDALPEGVGERDAGALGLVREEAQERPRAARAVAERDARVAQTLAGARRGDLARARAGQGGRRGGARAPRAPPGPRRQRAPDPRARPALRESRLFQPSARAACGGFSTSAWSPRSRAGTAKPPPPAPGRSCTPSRVARSARSRSTVASGSPRKDS